MREVEFRGKRIDNGEWVYGYLHHVEGEADMGDFGKVKINRTFILSPHVPDFAGWDIEDTFFDYAVDPKTVGQFIGEKIAGKKIYEGDILKWVLNGEVCKRSVDFNNGVFGLGSHPLFHIPTDFEVIGNIHDNPELLKS